MKDQGFTMVELLVVIGIIGILSAIAVPSYIGWLARVEAQSAANTLAQQMQRARTEAKRGTAQKITTTAGSKTITLTPVERVAGAWVATGSGVRTTTLEGATIQTTADLVFMPPYGSVEVGTVPQAYSVQSVRRTAISRSIRVISLMGKVVTQ
ncbi:Tfp pilus assembly protein FimT/FimU [Deinococcus hohokamensis]|uniref:Tfp pilus assembly protein FimT/FimU n=1 Tax=Deinococcus hohokamensis TaxID=309883 RepID=A0ABV9I328_9DEIO